MKTLRNGLCGLLLAVPCLLSGCASVAMKGTPFYTGQASARSGPAEERVNLWPAFYYRDPTVSLLWPIGEKSDDHLAIRPLMSVYGLNQEDKIWSFLWPLAQFDWQSDNHRIVPFFWGDDYFCGFPLYWHLGHPLGAGGGLDTLLPVWWYYGNGDSYSAWLAGPLLHLSRSHSETNWHAFPLAGNYAENSDYYRFLAWPLFHQWSHDDGAARGSAILPLYYAAHDRNWTRFTSPLYSTGKNAAGNDAYSLLFPFYYRQQQSNANLMATLLGGWRTDEAGRRWLIYPLLSWGEHAGGTNDYWAVAPLFHSRTERGAVTEQHLLPLYYRNRNNDMFLSPLAGQWKNDGGGQSTLIPPLLSYSRSSPKRNDLWLMGGLAHFSSGPNAGSEHVLPLYYRNRSADAFLSPLLARWQSGYHAETTLCPPLLSWYSTQNNQKDLTLLLGLAQAEWGTNTSPAGHLIPLYYHDGTEKIYTPLFGWNRNQRDGFFYPLTPLMGCWTGDRPGGWFFPFFSQRRGRHEQTYDGNVLWAFYGRDGHRAHSRMFPFYTYDNRGPIAGALAPGAQPGTHGQSFWCLPYCWYENKVYVPPSSTPAAVKNALPGQAAPATNAVMAQCTRKNGCFPLWSYASSTTVGSTRRETTARLLLLLYDYQRTVRPESPTETSGTDRTRTRVLWRLWHYERSNADVRVDVFPAITYDRKGADFKKTTFLWRCFRYERGPDGRKLDLLFVPLVREKSSHPNPDLGARTNLDYS